MFKNGFVALLKQPLISYNPRKNFDPKSKFYQKFGYSWSFSLFDILGSFQYSIWEHRRRYLSIKRYIMVSILRKMYILYVSGVELLGFCAYSKQTYGSGFSRLQSILYILTNFNLQKNYNSHEHVHLRHFNPTHLCWRLHSRN